MVPVISLGPLSLPASPLILLIGLWLGSSLAESWAKKNGENDEILFKITWISILAGVLGGRLSFIARNPGAFQGEWLSAVSLNPALLDPAGGLLIAFAAGYIVAARGNKATLSLLDDLVPFFAILAPAVHLANFASGAGYGSITNLPWGIELWGALRHPVQLYYLISSLVVLYLAAASRGSKERLPGSLMLHFIIYTSGYLTVLSAFQDPGGNLIGGLRTFQLVSWAVFSASLILAARRKLGGLKNAAS